LKDDLIRLSGVVDQVLPNATFRVILENQHRIMAYLGGKMKKFDIKIILGDNVELEISPYDLSKGRIVYRGK
jgi:translation initiation factor IF-1